VARKETSVKNYVIRLSAEKSGQLEDVIGKGNRSAQLLTKARILLNADVLEATAGATAECRGAEYQPAN